MANTKINTSNIATIKAVIGWAHDDMHNKRALSKKDFEDMGISENEFNNWVSYVNGLRDAVVEYNKLAQSKEATSKEIQAALGKVWSWWRAVVKEGTEEQFCKPFFIRKEDATMVANFAGLKAQDTARGKYFTNHGEADFRRNVETIIGIRMTGNALLSDNDRDLIEAYEGALKTIKNKTDLLEGTTDKKGNETKGLRQLVKDAEYAVKREEEFCKKYKVSEEEKADRLKGLNKKLKDTKDAVTDAEKALKKAEKTKAEKEEDYKAVIALLKSVGDYQ